MNYLDKLLKDVEVEWKDLSEVATIGTGSHDTKDSTEDGEYTFYARGRVPLKLDSYDFEETAIITAGDGVGVGKVFHWVEGKYALHQRAYRIVPKSNVNARYIYHYFLSNFHAHVKKISVHSSVTSLRKPMFLKFQVPIPCPEYQEKSLEIQGEIVRILDSFAELTTNLTDKLAAELTARKKQFIYYREELFKFEKDKVGFELLDEIGEFQRGKRFVKTDLISEGVPTIHYGEMYTHYGPWADKTISFVSQKLVDDKNLRLAEKGDVVIVAAGETIEDIGQGTAWLGDEGAVIHDACFGFRSHLNPKFVAYFTRTRQFHNQIRKHIRTGKISAINSKGLSKVIIPVPSPEEQERIVSILDRFDTLTKSISEVLPKEIELRDKQYEYYRDMLLTFPKEKIEA
ncbi:restriction endonuclease subunit S [Leptobacterium flavescens]|uniref:Restriction endonuclease subunit S n=1 Tax=Leptobacterium flavescens TaxID=472055 RepID=A0A6P0UP41_9FLAO|nr:restriction endonuclease subunit S [Leptobacterium flavescens]NER12116.1 restriction endonuclease subunit S [Leptobacterium flavescens]